MSHIVDELQWRGLVAQTTDEEELRKTLAAGPIAIYCGFDPTAASLHVGHLLQLILLKKLQQAGHQVYCLVGGATGLIGDPRPTAERSLRSAEETSGFVESIQRQVSPFLDLEGPNPAVLVNNLDWSADITAIDFLRDLGKHFRVNQMLRKESVAARLNSDQGISYTEFSYQILQANDYLHLFRTYGCRLQTGAVDQWGNITAGVDLIHRVEGESVHALTTPLMTTADGTKLGKSEGNAVWLDPDLFSPYAFYQYWINVEDASVVRYLKAFTDRSPEEIEELERLTAQEPFRREGQRTLARDITTLVHGAGATEQVESASQVLFGKADPRQLDERTLADATAELPQGAVEAGATIADALVASGLVPSKGAARRTVAEGGASVNNERVTDAEAPLKDDDYLYGRLVLLKRGKKNLAVVTRVASQ